jgi:peptidoglycan/LPS O-acetylase OafA/YrhL
LNYRCVVQLKITFTENFRHFSVAPEERCIGGQPIQSPQPNPKFAVAVRGHAESQSMAELLPSKPKSKRILELDALRALSCLNLLLFHFTYVYENKYGFATPLGFEFPYGKYGVQLFFMLSGLVNAMTLLSKRKPKEFLIARCIRIFPSYWLVIILNIWLFAMLPMYHMTATPGDYAIANLTSMPQLFGYSNMEPVTWTLQIEMLFYAFLMILLAAGLLDRPLPTMMVAIVICLVCCTFFGWFLETCPTSVWNRRFKFVEDLFFMRNLPLFSIGILLNEIRSKRGNRWLLSMGILASAIVFHTIDLRDHNPAATILIFATLALSAFGKLPMLRIKPLIFISTISYSLYLFHNNLGCAFMNYLETIGCGPWVAFGLGTAFAIGVGSAVTFWFEQPISAFLRREWSAMKNRFEWQEQPCPLERATANQ